MAPIRRAFVPPAGFEPAPPPPEGGALSPELRGPGAATRLAAENLDHGASITVDSLADVAGAGRVLVVDDDDVICQLITVNLELEGFDVVTAVDGQDALDKGKEAQPVVVTLDVMMPRVDGWEAASRLHSDPETAHIKVVLLSARAQEADIQRGERIGVDAYLTKPFDPDELIDVVRRLVDAANQESAGDAPPRSLPSRWCWSPRSQAATARTRRRRSPRRRRPTTRRPR